MANRKGKKKVHKPAKGRKRPHATDGGKLPKQAATLMVILRAREGQETLLEAELRALVGPSRKEDACLTYDFYRSIDIPGAFLLHEVWASREAHIEHTHTPHFMRWNARKDALLASRDGTFWQQIV